ncbi:hypothetical protein BKA58DRAFT_392321 [Alternaria rosae]|uniref:uncharacterized protein n=1 Tax=Alternaria rosae TaxID=1187941 RepID=UPI001E8E3037|nr:uncharacterized protein BKA58DRAFT_392321 [Alternaria rosae]KAH6860868.1 hypothetical protein BKA58DRAFT_392321 [Alternaria rosae]
MASVSTATLYLPSFAVLHAVQHRLRPSCHRFQRVSFAAEPSSNGHPCSQQSSTTPFHPPDPSLGRTRGSLQRGCKNTAHSACASLAASTCWHRRSSSHMVVVRSQSCRDRPATERHIARVDLQTSIQRRLQLATIS